MATPVDVAWRANALRSLPRPDTSFRDIHALAASGAPGTGPASDEQRDDDEHARSATMYLRTVTAARTSSAAAADGSGASGATVAGADAGSAVQWQPTAMTTAAAAEAATAGASRGARDERSVRDDLRLLLEKRVAGHRLATATRDAVPTQALLELVGQMEGYGAPPDPLMRPSLTGDVLLEPTEPHIIDSILQAMAAAGIAHVAADVPEVPPKPADMSWSRYAEMLRAARIPFPGDGSDYACPL